MGALTACSIREKEESADLGLNIKVFSPTKVVVGSQMTISGSGLSGVTEVVFPEAVSVKGFKVVSDGMIRVTVPAGISAEGGQIIVRTADDEAVSELPMTMGHPVISGYSKQPGESIQGGEQLTIYGKDLEFISSVEMLDADGNPVIIPDSQFYRKGTSTVIIIVPKKVYEGTFIGKVNTVNGLQFMMPELAYEPAAEGGHWETVKKPFWENAPDGPSVAWSSNYRFCLEGQDTNPDGPECLAEFPQDVWNRLKSETFYLIVKSENPQVRVTTGWWDPNFRADDYMPGDEAVVDNEDGTWTITLNISGNADFCEAIDTRHILFTGDRYTPVALCFDEEEWVPGGGGGHTEEQLVPFWQNAPDGPSVAWSSDYRFCLEGQDTNPDGPECLAEFPQDVWDKMKTETFYIVVKSENPQVRVTTGWWDPNFRADDYMPGDEAVVDNGDGTWTITVNLANNPEFCEAIDTRHILFTGDRYTPVSLCFMEEVWVPGGDEGPKKDIFWENDGGPSVAWSSNYRFCLEGQDTNPDGPECLAEFPQDVWDKIKSGNFYLDVASENPQVRVTTGWWDPNFRADDYMPGDEAVVDNEDGTWTITLNISGNADFCEAIDARHILFTGDRYTPLRLYFLK